VGGLAFGAQRVATTSGVLSASLQDSGSGPLSIASIGVAGANPGDFFVTSDCPVAPAQLAVGAICSISVSFTPAAVGARSASVQIADNAAGSPQSVALSGTGTAPAVSLAPASLSFGSLLVGSTSTAQSSTLTNSGSAPLTISSLTAAGSNAADFSVGSGCPLAPATLPAGGSCTISVTFRPGGAGARSGSVQIADDAAGSPHSLPLSGSGSTSAIAFDKNLGSKTYNVASTTMALTTTAAAAAHSRVFVFVQWNNSTRTLTSVSGGGLTWTVDIQAKEANNEHLAIASADNPAGLAAGATITATFSGSAGHGLIAGASFTGVSAQTPLDATASSTGSGSRTWSATLTTQNASDLVLAVSTIDANTTSTTSQPATEIHDYGDVNYYAWQTSAYQTTTSPGTQTTTGTWAANTNATGNLTITAAYKSG